jgi:superfamily II DNA or RNA helicase
MELSADQKEHAEVIFSQLQHHGIAYDTSATGSGKTVVAAKIAKRLNKQIIVLGSPILKENWDKTMKIEGIKYQFTSIFQKSISWPAGECMVILDECQAVKNSCQRTARFIDTICRNKRVKFMLMLSATPFDHPRHERVVSEVIQKFAHSNLSFHAVCQGMNFKYPTNIDYVLHHVEQSPDELKAYNDGYRKIRSSHSSEGEGVSVFKPGVFSIGLRMIHESLLEGFMRRVRETTGKRVAVLKYSDDFGIFQKEFPNCLVINGSISQPKRARIIAEFQTTDAPLLAITDVIGGVGIDLDDQDGSAPRTIITMPLFAADFVQLAGRVRRRNSKSDSKIIVIQPNLKKTYFKKQMETKLPVLSSFNNSLGFMETPRLEVEHGTECKAQKLLLGEFIADGLAVSLVNLYACECAKF